MPNKIIHGVYDTTVLGIRRGHASHPRHRADLSDTFFADIIVNGAEHTVEFHLLKDVHGYSGSVGLSAAFPMSKDALPFLGGLAERMERGEIVTFPVRALI
jgi:hypothetical protein